MYIIMCMLNIFMCNMLLRCACCILHSIHCNDMLNIYFTFTIQYNMHKLNTLQYNTVCAGNCTEHAVHCNVPLCALYFIFVDIVMYLLKVEFYILYQHCNTHVVNCILLFTFYVLYIVQCTMLNIVLYSTL